MNVASLEAGKVLATLASPLNGELHAKACLPRLAVPRVAAMKLA